MKKFFLLLSILLFFLSAQNKARAQNSLVSKIYNITDEAINGFAYDPTCPSTPVQVHLYTGDKWANGADRPSICTAKFACPWPGICDDLNGNGKLDDGHGFWCTPRHPLTSDFVTDSQKLQYKIAVVSQCRADTVLWLDVINQSPPVIRTVVQNRENDTIFVDKPNYKIGITKRFGGAVVEYYNKRGSADDAQVNLIKPAAGEALQTTVFGKNPVGAGVDCFGTAGGEAFGVQGPVYNPTQTGSYCTIPNPSQVEKCFANGQETACNNLQNVSQTVQSIGFLTHYRNFTYPRESDQNLYFQYKPYEDVWGTITYSFTDQYVQIDYDVEKRGSTSYGSAQQQFPIAFLNNLTRFTYQENGTIKTTTPTISSVVNYPITNEAAGRWFTGVSAPFTASDGTTVIPDAQQGFLTMAMYSDKVGNSCPTRHLQINNVPFGFGATYLSQVETTTVAAQNYLELELLPQNHIHVRAFLFPYNYNDVISGSTLPLSQRFALPDTNGGFVPPWECNMPNQSPTPTPTPLPGDVNGDGKVDIFDYNLLVTDFGKTGSPGFTKADIDNNGKVDIFDYNILVGNFGKVQ